MVELTHKERAWAESDTFAKKFINQPLMIKELYKIGAIAKNVESLQLKMKCAITCTPTNIWEKKPLQLCNKCNAVEKNCKCDMGSPGYSPHVGMDYMVYDSTYNGNDITNAAVKVQVAPWNDHLPRMEFYKEYIVEGEYSENNWNGNVTYYIDAVKITPVDAQTQVDTPTPTPTPKPAPEPVTETVPPPQIPGAPAPQAENPNQVQWQQQQHTQVSEPTPEQNTQNAQKLTQVAQTIEGFRVELEGKGFLTKQEMEQKFNGLDATTRQSIITELKLYNHRNRWFSDIIDG